MATTDTTDADISLRVSRALDQAGITVPRVAETLGIHRVNAWRKLSGRARIRLDELQTLAELAGVPIGDLINGTDKAAS